MWAPKTHQVLIASKPVINKSKQSAELLVENPILPPAKPLQQSAGKPKLQGKLRKRPFIENKVEYNGSVRAEVLNESGIKTEDSYNNLVQRSRIDQGMTSGKNPPKGLVKPAREFAKSVIKTSSKVREPKTYNEVLNNPNL